MGPELLQWKMNKKTEKIRNKTSDEEKFCPFCQIPTESILLQNKLCIAVLDKYPVSPGHALIIPKRHFPDYFQASKMELQAINELLFQMKTLIIEKFNPSGFNIGVNIGKDAGQTIFHLHVHLIPRYRGDVKNPEGGVRHIIPGKGYYPTVN